MKRYNISNYRDRLNTLNLDKNNAWNTYMEATEFAESSYQTEYFEELTCAANLKYEEYLAASNLAANAQLEYKEIFHA